MKVDWVRIGIGLVIGVLLSWAVIALIALGLGMLQDGLTVRRAQVALVLGSITAVVYWVWFPCRVGGGESSIGEHSRGLSFWMYGLIFVYVIACLRSYLWLIGESKGWVVIGSPFNLGDLALHIQLTQYLASGVRFWPESPIILDEPLRYPVGIHLLGAVLLKLGMDILPLMIWMGLVGAVLTGVALWRWGGWFAMALLLFCGGLAGFVFLQPGWMNRALMEPEWKNLFLAVFVTQRGFLWALPAGLILLAEWRHWVQGGRGFLPVWGHWILLGAMPLFHLHTFLYLGGMLGVCWLLSRGEGRWKLLRVGMGALVLAFPLGWLVTGGGRGGGIIGWNLGWMPGGERLGFWIWNFGLWLPMLGVLVVWLWRNRDRVGLGFVGYGVAVLVACGLVRFAPWAWDNVKLMVWSFLAAAPFFRELWARLPTAMQAVLAVGMFWSGGVALWEGLGQHQLHRWLEVREWRVAESLLRGVPRERARVATKPDVPHPVALCGYAVAVGYPGHLWSHGISYRPAELALEKLYRDGVQEGLLRNVTHVYVGMREQAAYGARDRQQVVWLPPPAGWEEVMRIGSTRLFQRSP